MRAIVIPVDVNEPIYETDVGPYPALGELIGGWIERVITPETHQLAQSDYDLVTRSGGERFPSVTIWVDEEGLLKPLPANVRASKFYPESSTPLCGVAVLLGEDLVDDGEGCEEPDAVSLPERVTIQMVEDFVRA